MSQIIKNEDGTEVEVFTLEELEAQKLEAIESYKLDNPDKTDELEALQAELKEKEEALAKANNKDKNFSILRKSKEEAEKKVQDLLKGVDEKVNLAKKEIMEGVLKDHYNDTIKTLVGDDKELEKKVEYHYKRLTDSASTKAEVANKLKDAYLLATKLEGNDANMSVFSSGAVGKIKFKESDKTLSPDEKAVGSKLGLSEEDFKKYL